MSIPELIAKCDAYCKATGAKRVWLSKRLFQDTYRLDHLASGESDVGVKRLERAFDELRELEAQHGGASENRPAA